MKIGIEQLRFADCYLLSLKVHREIKNLQLKFEAYIPNSRIKNVVLLEVWSISKLNIEMKSEFQDDLAKSHNLEGFDQKANEIYGIEFTTESEKLLLRLDSDMLNLSAEFVSYSIEKIID